MVMLLYSIAQWLGEARRRSARIWDFFCGISDSAVLYLLAYAPPAILINDSQQRVRVRGDGDYRVTI